MAVAPPTVPGFTVFDREATDLHYLTVEARDDEGRGNRNTVEILISVQDVNDNSPLFAKPRSV